MSNNTVIALLVLSSIIGSGFSSSQDSNQKQKKPNVLILFSDQHNKNVMGFEGHPDVITPNLDKLAKGGVVFDRAYCTTGI
jgi:arylsulfatase